MIGCLGGLEENLDDRMPGVLEESLDDRTPGSLDERMPRGLEARDAW